MHLLTNNNSYILHHFYLYQRNWDRVPKYNVILTNKCTDFNKNIMNKKNILKSSSLYMSIKDHLEWKTVAVAE